MNSRILIVGGLAAGPAAASKAARTNSSAEVILFEQSEYISYGICEIPYYISNKIHSYNDLILFAPEKFKSEKKVDVKTSCSIREIEPQKKTITVFNTLSEKMERYSYDKLIITTGSRAKTLPELSANLKNVFYLKSLSDGIAIKKFIEYNSPKSAIVIGAGFIALEISESFKNLGMDVTLLDTGLLPSPGFEDETRKFLLEKLLKNDIKYIHYDKIKSIGSDSTGKITGILYDEFSIKADIVIISIGVEPASELAKSAGISIGKNGGILIDSKMRTNINNIFAAGDCCEIKNLITNKYTYSPFASLAQKTGWAAGENAAGGNAIIKGIIPAYTISAFGAEAAHVGLTLKQANEAGFSAEKTIIEGWARPKIFPGAEKLNIILIYNKIGGGLLGADVFGTFGAALRANILSTAIYSRLTLNDLMNLDFVYNPPSTPQRDPILICAGKGLDSLKFNKKY